MKTRPQPLIFIALLMILIIAMTACLPDPVPPPPIPDSSGSGETDGGDQSATETPENGEGTEDVSTGDSEPPPDTPASRIAADVPILEGAYDMNVSGSGLQITYKVGLDVDSVVFFYQEQLASLGWESAGPSDTAVGATALMLRKNAANDRISINMQFNPNASFTVVTLVINRAQ